MRLVYIATHYPAVSHTFVLREVRALRRHGVSVDTASVRRTPETELLSQADREEARATFAILPISPAALLATHLRALLRTPRRYLATLAYAQRISPGGLRSRLWQLFYFAEAVVLREHYRPSPEPVHLHAQFADAATDVALLATRLEPEWSWSLAVHGPVEFYDIPGHKLAEKLQRARFALAISDFGRSQLMTLVDEDEWDKLHVVHCGVEPATFAAVSRDGRPGAMEVLCVGRLVNLKGQRLLVDAVAELAQRGLDVRATLVGDGPKRADLERLARDRGVADRVTFTGSVGQDEIRELYARAEVFCLPSFAEGVPVVLMEAMAVQLPVVTTRIMGIPELVDDGTSGILIRPGRLSELVAALEALAADPELRHRLGTAAREKVLAEYDVDRSAEELRRILSQASVS